MVRLAQTVALLLAAIPAALATEICHCNNDRYTYGACQFAIQATANPPKSRRDGAGVDQSDAKNLQPQPQYPHWTYLWYNNKSYCSYQWKGDPQQSTIWNVFAKHCLTGASCLG
ncbi:unnamed protein product [Zymoseptoria tritici ST99CH_3D7]|uniref:Uncharacterized protein n=1 Tax=Zymoseptoria tritici (strain ST99CH_3D7) TaxID=1276538 RepID=A0A1X7RV73_ZYMT9|nr:unnamed protein product [Zymoseptoria tritici ST99CH_3D7]